jgi:hypothetical protein
MAEKSHSSQLVLSARVVRQQLESGVFEPVGVLLVYRLGVCLKQAVQAQKLINFVQVVHEVVVSNYLAEVIAATAYESIILAETER